MALTDEQLLDAGVRSGLIEPAVLESLRMEARRLCKHCRRPRLAGQDELLELGATDERVEVYEPVGCAACQGTGFRGRLGLFETLWFDEKLARLVARGADEEALEASAGERLRFMWEDGCRKVRLGLMTLDKVRDVAVNKTREMLELS